jgi:hypothetical protein
MKRLRLRGDWSDTGPNARPDARTSPQPSTSESPREPENSRPDRTPQQIQLQQSLAAANLISSNSPEQPQAETNESRDQEESQLADSVSADGGAADDDQAGQARGRGPPVNMNLMQRMTDALSRMLNDPSTRLAMRTLSEREASRFVKLSFCPRLYNRSRFFRLEIRFFHQTLDLLSCE